MPRITEVDTYFSAGCGRCSLYNTPACKVHKWHAELHKLRSILLSTPLQEEAKWGVPCYTFQQNNVIILNAFKENCVISFFKGALLPDPENILIKPGEATQAARVIRFTTLETIIQMETTLLEYINQAIEIEKAGLKPNFKKTLAPPIPKEFEDKLNENPALKTAFETLTEGRQKAYLLHFLAAKQSQTRTARIEKCLPDIINGIGLNEKYILKP